MRAAKKGFRSGISVEPHAALPPSLPPVPPSPVNPALVPVQPWLHFIVNPLMGWVATGKYSNLSISTEGDGTILWQHEWGPLQPHRIYPAPVIETPSTLLLLFGSSAKYYLPSFSVKQPVDGVISGGATPVAICFPAYIILLETCADISTKGFNIPLPGVCLQSMTTRWVGFRAGDFFAGLIAVAGDALASLVLSHFGGKLFSGMSDNQLFGALGGSFANIAGGIAGNYPVILLGLALGFVGAGAAHGEGDISTGTFHGLGGILLAPIIAWGFGLVATEVGDTWGSKPGDAAPGWEQPPPDPAPSPAPPPASPTPSAGAPDGGGTTGPEAGTPPPATGTGGSPDGGAPPPPNTGGGGAPDAGAGTPQSSSSDDATGTDDSGGVCTPPPPWL